MRLYQLRECAMFALPLVVQHLTMIELTAEIPFLWRLGAESSEGYCSVSMIVPCPPETEIKDLTIETSVLSLSSDSTRSEKEETLEWNQEDISLFLKLVNQKQLANKQPISDTVRIDLTDPAVIDIIHIVAAAGFGVAFTSYGLLKESNGLYPGHPLRNWCTCLVAYNHRFQALHRCGYRRRRCRLRLIGRHRRAGYRRI